MGWGMGCRGARGRWEAEGGAGAPARGRCGRWEGLGIGLLKARNKTSRSSRHFSWYYREVTVNVSSGWGSAMGPRKPLLGPPPRPGCACGIKPGYL